MSQRIDHSNYEAWLLDRLEGRLSPEEDRALEAFLLAHPQLRPDEDEAPPFIGDASVALTVAEREALKRTLPPRGLVTPATLEDQLIARQEGDLSLEQERVLEEFLRAHPEHQLAERLFAHSRIAAEHVALPDRAGLHRDLPPVGLPDSRSLDDFLVARLEGDLDAEQERALDALLGSHDQARRAWALMAATRIPVGQVAYPHKAELKRGAKVIAIGAGIWMRRLAAAASIALLLGLGWWWQRSTSDEPPGFAAHGPQAPPAPSPSRSNDSVAEPSRSAVPDKQPALRTEEAVARPVRQQRPPTEDQRQVPLQEEPPSLPHPQPEPSAHERLALEPEPANMATQEAGQTRPEDLLMAANPEPRERDGGEAVPTLRQALAGAVRERVLESAADPARPFDASDAEAATNRVLRTVAGEQAAFSVRRDAEGRSKGFELRLGRHMAVSARR